MKRSDFTRGLIRELANARGDCSAGSFMNCHAIGLHSIVLRELPMVRVFVTTPDHELWKVTAAHAPKTIAFHSHRSDIVLETVRGQFWNWTAGDTRTRMPIALDQFKWDSAINGGSGTFTRLDGQLGCFLMSEHIGPGNNVTMRASEIHTVQVPKEQLAAWLVTEGAEDPGYDAVSYSTEDLSEFVPDDLYRPMTPDEARELISWVTESAP